ncbi:hypothetical protein MNBD_ACTINO02-1619 [hydrothermal vent metagenome]|jgi:hypothetical protein|uniref:Uncharacterized protein n=1 Tax=hydrothermal vent metagenome TaxID=652676 RepID=A0A3B0TQ90_9ZZZZ
MKLPRLLGMLSLLLLVFAACSNSDEAISSTVSPTLTTLAPAQTGVEDAVVVTTTSTTFAIPDEIGYSIVKRIDGADGDIVVVLLDPTTYTSLTDIDLLGITQDVIEAFPPILEAHIVDTQEAADAVLAEDPTDEQKAALAENYLLALEDGIKVTFLGPFASFGTDLLGS